jgi:DNA sulfur modification protein DndE
MENQPESIITLAQQAYIYGFPLVMMYESMRSTTNYERPVENSFFAPVNQFAHFRTFPDAKFRSMVKPNNDTYYTNAWLDLSEEPIVLSVPNTKGRYYLLPMFDAYTNVFASPGKRTTGTAAQTFLITGPSFNGTVPEGMQQIQAPTNMVWILGRTQVNSPQDGKDIVYPIQNGYKLTPLRRWGTAYQPEPHLVDNSIALNAPAFVENMDISTFFNVLNEQLAKNPPPEADAPVLAKLATIGVGPGKQFDLSGFDGEVQAALKLLPAAVLAQLRTIVIKGGKHENNWGINRSGVGNYGTDYLVRAIFALVGLGANLNADASYPNCQLDSNGERLYGAKNYVLHFEKGQTPPANAFWSLTIYGPDDFLVDNPIDRYSVGDRSDLRYNPDGSLDIHIQNKSPEPDKLADWLPSPEGLFSLTMRIYWPKESYLNGSWEIPAVRLVQ